MELRSLSVESLDISEQRYNSFMRFSKGFLGKFGENFCRTAGSAHLQFASALEIVFVFELVGC